MEELMEILECIEDTRQQSKVRYPIKEIVLIVFSCTLSNVDNWEDMEMWANHYIDLLREYLPFENGIPSHDTIQRVMGMIDPEYIQQAYNKWTSMLEKEEKEKFKKIIAIWRIVLKNEILQVKKIQFIILNKRVIKSYFVQSE